MSSQADEAEAVREVVSGLTNAEFEIMDIKDQHPDSKISPIWFMSCREITQANKIPHVQAIWRGKGEIRIESLTIGNTSDWIEESGGEEAVYPVLEMDLTNFWDPGFRKRFLRGFPDLKIRLGWCEAILADVSKKRGVKLEIRFDGGKGLAVFYIDAKVKATPEKIGLEIKRVENALKALKEAYSEVAGEVRDAEMESREFRKWKLRARAEASKS